MKILLIVTALLTLTGCGVLDRGWAYLSGYSEGCIDGVVYIQFPSGVTVKYDQTGNVQKCED